MDSILRSGLPFKPNKRGIDEVSGDAGREGEVVPLAVKDGEPKTKDALVAMEGNFYAMLGQVPGWVNDMLGSLL